MSGIMRSAFLVLALTCSAVLASEAPTVRRVAPRETECTNPDGCRCLNGVCRGFFDLDDEDLPRLAERTAERERTCAEKSEPWACTWAGRRAENGEGVPRDARKAAQLYAVACHGSPGNSASNQGCVALARLAQRLDEGQGFSRDPDLAAALYVESCRAERSPDQMWLSGQPGCLALAREYLRGEIIARNLARAGAIYSAACNGPGHEAEACVGVVLVDVAGGLGDPPGNDSSRYWLDPKWLTAVCADGASDPVACRALAFRYQRGSRVSADPERARVLFERACVRGDAPSCQELRGAPTNEVASGCAAGNAESCWHRDLRFCRGDLPMPATATPEAPTAWSACVDARRRCGEGDGASCVNLAYEFAEAFRGVPLARERQTETLERGLLLHEEACTRGDAPSCFAAAELLARCRGIWCVAATSDKDLHARGIALETDACEAGDVETCLRLTARYPQNGVDEAPDPRRVHFYKRAAEIDEPACAAGDLKVCERLSQTYDRGLRNRGRAIGVWRRACRAGAPSACETLARFKDNGAFGVTTTFGVRWGQPTGWSGSLTFLLGERYVSHGSSHSTFVLPGYSGRGWLLQLEPGLGGVKVGAGWGQANTVIAPPLTTGYGVKLSFLQGWRNTGPLASGNNYAGVEADLSVIGLKGSIGLYQGVGRDRGVLVTWGVGLGF